MDQMLQQLVPAIAFVILGLCTWRMFARRVRARNGIKPVPARKRHSCGPGSGIDREFVGRRIGQVKSLTEQAHAAVQQLADDGFDASGMRRLVEGACKIVGDVEHRLRQGCTDFPFLAIQLTGASHKAEGAIARCRFFNRQNGKVEIPRDENDDSGCWSCGG
jgi:hypothetical protein